jgi:hypothetical protein
MNFIKGLGELMKPVMDQIVFTPRYVTYSSEKNSVDFKNENCVSNGKYCATSHYHRDVVRNFDTESRKNIETLVKNIKTHVVGRGDMLTGRDMLMENLYQCELGYQHHLGNQFDFFTYIGFINDQCGARITKNCHDLGVFAINGDIEKSYELVNKTFETPGDIESDNQVFNSSLRMRQKLGIHVYPAVVINDLIFRGQHNPDNVFEAICASFKNMPEGCYEWE